MLVLDFRAPKFSRSATSELLSYRRPTADAIVFKFFFSRFCTVSVYGDYHDSYTIIMSDVSKETLKKEIAGNYYAPPLFERVTFCYYFLQYCLSLGVFRKHDSRRFPFETARSSGVAPDGWRRSRAFKSSNSMTFPRVRVCVRTLFYRTSIILSFFGSFTTILSPIPNAACRRLAFRQRANGVAGVLDFLVSRRSARTFGRPFSANTFFPADFPSSHFPRGGRIIVF